MIPLVWTVFVVKISLSLGYSGS